MGRYRKRPVVIDAYAYDDLVVLAAGREAFVFAGQRIVRTGADFYIQTLEGIMQLRPGDWLIVGVQGELYPCKPDIFAATYEPADET